MKAPIDWSLYLVTDRRLAGARPLEELVVAAVCGGVSAVQLREKDCDTREFVELARTLKLLLSPLGIPLLINDRVDVAMAAGADGVHIGQSDMDYHDVRRLVGPDMRIGLSVDTVAQAVQAAELDAAYLGVGPIFQTGTKLDAGPALGIEGFAALRAASRHILVGIGGIHASNAGDVMRAGADGIAVVSAICCASDPQRAAAEIRAVLNASRQRPRQRQSTAAE